MSLVGCPHCQAVTEADRFCTQCGQHLPLAGPPGAPLVVPHGTAQRDGLCLAAMIVGLCSIIIGAPISSFAAIIMASIALNRGVAATDRTYALVGLWTGIASAAMTALGLFVFGMAGGLGGW